MSTRNFVEELEHSDAKGLDTTSPINLMASGFVREAMNVNLGSTGGYTKRDGYVQQLTSPATGQSIRQGIEFRQSTGSPQLILHSTDNTAVAKLSKVVAGSLVSLKNMFGVDLQLDPFKRPSFAQVGDSLFYFDGSLDAEVPLVYEGNGEYTRLLGIDPPTSKPTYTTVGSGGSLEEGQYIYAYTYAFYLNNQLIAESSPSELSDTITTVLNDTVNLTLVPFPDLDGFGNLNLSHLTIMTRIWRTVVNGSILFLEAEIAGTSSSHPSTASDNSLLSEQIPLDNTRLSDYTDYDKARFPIVSRNRLLVFHPEQNRGRFSKIGVNGPLPESFPVNNEFSTEGRFGAADNLVGAGQIRGIPIILKERSVGRLEEIGLPDLGNSADSVTYIYREISETIGAVSHFAQCQVFDELVFLGRDNVYATDGQNVRPIAIQLQSTIKACDFSGNKVAKLSAINDTKNRRIYIQVFKAVTSAEPDLTLVGDYQQYPTFRWTTYNAGSDETANPGIKAGCFFQTEATASGGLDIFFGSATSEGQYYKMNTGYSDYFNGVEKAIFMRLASRPYMFGQPLIPKLYKTARIWAEGRDSTYEFDFGAKFDLEVTEVNKESFTVLGVGTVWAPSSPTTYLWSSGSTASPNLLWTGPALQEYVYSIHRKAKMMQLIFTQDDKNAPLTLLGWGVSGSIFSGV
jgi:hypothetical protein